MPTKPVAKETHQNQSNPTSDYTCHSFPKVYTSKCTSSVVSVYDKTGNWDNRTSIPCEESNPDLNIFCIQLGNFKLQIKYVTNVWMKVDPNSIYNRGDCSSSYFFWKPRVSK